MPASLRWRWLRRVATAPIHNVLVHAMLLMASISMVISAEKISAFAISSLRLDESPQYRNGAIASEHAACSKAGIDVMAAGGSAVDGAIAGLLCIGVVNNVSAGIGGGGFMLVRDGATGQSEVVDFREVAPASASWDMFVGDVTSATESTRSTGVPGEIRGFAAAHAKYGAVPWAHLFRGAIEIATSGFQVTERMHASIAKFKVELSRSSGMVETYFRPDGTPKQVGDFIFRPNLARTLQKIATEGPDAFYRGAIAESLVATIAELQGGLTMADMAAYRAVWRKPLIGAFAGFKVVTAGPPASGAILLQILNAISRLGGGGGDAAKDTAFTHRLMEIFKFAYAERMRLGDPDFEAEVEANVRDILSDQTTQRITSLVSESKTHKTPYYLNKVFAEIRSNGTTHLTAVDRHGTVASVTSTINLEWGCKHMDKATGIILNNELDDFSIPNVRNSFGLPPSRTNYAAAGKRPLSSATPVILERDGQVLMALGGAGGSRITTAVVETILNVILHGMAPRRAVHDCRIHHQFLPDIVMAERSCSAELLRELSLFGHQIVIIGGNEHRTSVNVVLQTASGGLIPVSDERKGGASAGY